MRKISLILAMILALTQTAFAGPWKCDKVSTENRGENLNLTLSCSNGIASPVIVQQEVTRPNRKGDVKNAIRNKANELKDRAAYISKTSAVQAIVDADNTLSASENDPDA